jgi:hypothetical protein
MSFVLDPRRGLPDRRARVCSRWSILGQLSEGWLWSSHVMRSREAHPCCSRGSSSSDSRRSALVGCVPRLVRSTRLRARTIPGPAVSGCRSRSRSVAGLDQTLPAAPTSWHLPIILRAHVRSSSRSERDARVCSSRLRMWRLPPRKSARATRLGKVYFIDSASCVNLFPLDMGAETVNFIVIGD